MGREAARCEIELLVACLRGSPDRPHGELRAAAARVADWDGAIARARSHGLECLLHLQLRSAAVDVVPHATLDALRAAYRDNVRRSLAQVMHTLHIVRLLGDNGIAAVPVKGASLAQSAYGDIAARFAADIDLVLDRRDVLAARDLLVADGHIPEQPVSRSTDRLQLATECEINVADGKSRAHVELHWRALPPAEGARLEGSALVARSTTTRLLDRPVAVLSSEDELLYAVLHGFKHRWARLEWVYALAQLMRADRPLDWQGLWSRANDIGCRRRLLFGLLLSAAIARAPLPDDLGGSGEGDDEVRALVTRQRDSYYVDHRSDPCRGDAVSTWKWHRDLLDGPGAVVAYAVRRTVLPSHEDWEWIALPGPLTPLYAVLRPARLSWRYLGRLRRRGSTVPPRPPRRP